MDGVKLTLFCTQGTADTAGLTYGLHILALVMGTALYQVCLLYTSKTDSAYDYIKEKIISGEYPPMSD